jgi:hypothetical protein
MNRASAEPQSVSRRSAGLHRRATRDLAAGLVIQPAGRVWTRKCAAVPDMVGIFPDRYAVICLARAVLMENDE